MPDTIDALAKAVMRAQELEDEFRAKGDNYTAGIARHCKYQRAEELREALIARQREATFEPFNWDAR